MKLHKTRVLDLLGVSLGKSLNGRTERKGVRERGLSSKIFQSFGGLGF